MSPYTLPQSALALGENVVVALTAKATLVMLAALLLIHLARRASASSRHLIAAASFGVLLLLPPATLLVPARVITVAAPPASTQLDEAAPTATVAHAPVPPPSGERALAPAFGMPRLSLLQAAGALYLLGAVALATVLLSGIWRLHRMRDQAEVSVVGTRVANAMARDLGMPGGIEVAVSPALAVPITFGWTHPVVLLPAEAAQWDEAAQARALRHEL